ncbi:MAG: MBOAT family protein, partial [Fusobacteriaceae bacterium]
WNFIIWGALHGAAILVHRIWKNQGYKMPALLGWAITLFSVNIFWVFFRAKDLAGAFKVLKAMVNYRSINLKITNSYFASTEAYLGNKLSLLLLVISFFVCFLWKKSIDKTPNTIFATFEISVYFVISILLLNRIATFLYFNF